MTPSSSNHDDPIISLGKSSRTLFDIIRDEESGTAYKDLVQRYSNTKNHSSKSLRDRLRICRCSSSRSSSYLSSSDSPPSSLSLSASSSKPVPASDVPLPSNRKSLHRAQSSLQTTDNSSHQILLQRTTNHSSFQRTQSSLSSRSQHLLIPANLDEPQGEEHQAQEAVVIPPDKQGEDAVAFPMAEEYQEDELVENEDDDEEQQQQQQLHINGDSIEDKSKNSNIFNNNEPPVKMSLLDLLAETDRQAGLVGRTYLTINDDDEDEEEGEEDQVAEEEEEEEGESVCCVCMVRHKGAAFIPCGHTFCRLCSRELWVSRGNCPLCNAYILEILDIF